MKADIKEQWVRALRSGDYKQGQGSLLDGGRFCCLGVLADLAVEDGVGEWGERENYECDGLPDIGSLPPAVQKWSGLRTNNPLLGDAHAITLNDGGVTFEEIADLIEQRL